jgi:hypothetical protein
MYRIVEYLRILLEYFKSFKISYFIIEEINNKPWFTSFEMAVQPQRLRLLGLYREQLLLLTKMIQLQSEANQAQGRSDPMHYY